MDWLNEAPAFSGLALQLLWIKILEICAVVLFALALLALLVVWLRHFSWRIRLCALLPLVASVGAGITAHALHDTYVYWVYALYAASGIGPAPPEYYVNLQHEIVNANHMATVLGWIFVLVTGLMLILSLLGLWRLIVSGQRGRLPASLPRASSSST